MIQIPSRRCILATAIVLFAFACKASYSSDLPNIVFILADDMGLGDVKCFGKDRSKAETPNIDSLAAKGMMFTDAHAPVAHCIPTRVAIMTGRYKFRFKGAEKFGPWGFVYPQFTKGHSTIGTVLKRVGYHTGYIGKWHLGLEMATSDGKPQGPKNVDYSKPIRQGPNERGFDQSFILPGSLDMFPYVFARNQEWLGRVNSQKGWSAFNRVGPAAEDFEDYKVLNAFSTEAETFIDSHASKKNPFFLYVALTAPHTPTSPSPKFRGKSKLGLYGDFLMETDHCVGRIVNALRKNEIDKNTLVIFTSDHGAANYAGNVAKATYSQHKKMEELGHFSSGIYRGHKFSAYEGGTRIPFVANWPGSIKPGSFCKGLIGLNDMMATLAEVAGARLSNDEAPDSISFRNLLLDPKSKSNREFMICRSTNAFTIRQGDWKLLLCPGSGCSGRWGNEPKRDLAWKKAIESFGRKPKRSEIREPDFCQLFDLENDPGESQNRSHEFPGKILSMGKLLDSVLANGRSTPGARLKNDRNFQSVNDVPRFVFER